MKIYETEDDGIIGEFKYQTVEFTRLELVEGGVGVISQGAVQRYFAKENPDLKVKKFGSFKFDSQKDVVTARFAVYVIDKRADVYPTVISNTVSNAESDGQKLLNPGYDEFLLENKKLKEEIQQLKTGQEEYDGLLRDYKNQSDEVKKLQERYDALVIAVGKDAQKFSDLLVENETLSTQYDNLIEKYKVTGGKLEKKHKECEELNSENNDLTTANSRLREETTRLTPALQAIDLTSDDEEEDAADLEEAKEAIDSDSNTTLTLDMVEKACDQAEVVGPDEVEITGIDGSRIAGEKAEGGVRGDRHKEIIVADLESNEVDEEALKIGEDVLQIRPDDETIENPRPTEKEVNDMLDDGVK